MKKTMKVMALLLFAITMSTVLCSCTKEDSSSQRKIKGGWQVTHFYGSQDYDGSVKTWDTSYENGIHWVFETYFDQTHLRINYYTGGTHYGFDYIDEDLQNLIRSIPNLQVFLETNYTISDDTLVFPTEQPERYRCNSAHILELTNTTLILRFEYNYVFCGQENKYEATIEFKKD